ncbi:MAG: EVE domain-containing protein, partial [Actinomycetota bacterium]|nr:EVE domain-containing protein [Actinomycetota bacterium]
YKIDLGAKVWVAREAFLDDRDWWEPLNEAFRSSLNNLTRWNQHGAYLTWALDNQEEAARGLGAIWDPERPIAERISGFMEHFPTNALSGAGMRTTIASVLLLADDPTSYPPYRPTTFNDGYRLVGYPTLPTSADEAEIYVYALSFLDRIIAEAAERGLMLRDQLDGQAVLWSVLKNGLSDSATEEQRKALALYRKDFRPAWWVNQGATFAEERSGHYVWAPQKTKGGFPVKHHTDVLQMKRGDTVLHYANGALRAIGLVTKSGHAAERPSSLPTEAWQVDGFRANVRYFDLDRPIKLTEIPIDARESENTAFTKQGSVKQGYLYGLSQDFSDDLREQFAERWPPGSPWYHRPPNYWLFQARPDVWDLAAYVAEHDAGHIEDWIVTRYREEMEPGDVVLLWQAGDRAGIYAIAEIDGKPFERSGDDNFIADADQTEWAVNLRMVDTSMSPVLKPGLVAHPILRDLAVIRNAQGTNFKVTREQWSALQDLLHDVRTLAVAVTDEVALQEVTAGRYGWDKWHSDYNLVGRGDRVVFAVVGSREGRPRLQAVVSSDGIYEDQGSPRYPVDFANVTEVDVAPSPQFDEALIRSGNEGGRGVLVEEPHTNGVSRSLEDAVDAFSEAVRVSNLDYGERHDDLMRAFTVSLATKRFVLLTGLSGSGKTRLALAFGQWLGNDRYQVEAVRPDWTGPDALLGYEDGLSKIKATGRAWHVPRPLEFMLRAARDPHHAYLLVLDEMNLAHVERYFADVLSGMESGEPILPNLARDEVGEWRIVGDEPDRIPFPSNLFVAGTVNIDETTYMFSPKVLDRANTLEFRVRTEDLIMHAEPPDDVLAAADPLVAAFLGAAVAATEPWAGAEKLARYLQGLHGILSEDDREFGHRVFFEAQRFGALLAEAGDDDVSSALDLQVMQKILPRYHGSLRQLAGPLATIGEWAYRLETSADGFDPLGESIEVGQAKLPISFDKIRRMTRRLRANHFVSFAE